MSGRSEVGLVSTLSRGEMPLLEAPVDGAYVTRVTSSAGSESNSNHLASPGVKPYKQGSLGYGRGNKPMRGPEGSPPLVA